MAKKIQSNSKRKKEPQSSKSKQKGTKTVRESSSLSGLNKKFFSKVKQEFHDLDYTNQLDSKNKAYMSSFMEETLGARFNHDGKKFIKTKSGKKKIYNENNARQRDVYSLARATGRIANITPEAALDQWQSLYINHNPEELMSIEPDTELLTYQEYTKLLNSDATIPDDLKMFYDALYFEDFELLKKRKA